MLGFQNRTLDNKLMKFYVNRDNRAYLEKCSFQRKLVLQIWDCHWIHGIETNMKVVLDPDSKFRLAMHAKRCKTSIFHSLFQKTWLFANDTKHRKIIYQIKTLEDMSWYVPVSSPNDDWGERNDSLKPWLMASLTPATSGEVMVGSWPSTHEESMAARNVREESHFPAKPRRRMFGTYYHHKRPPASTTVSGMVPAPGSTFLDPPSSVVWPMLNDKGEREREVIRSWKKVGMRENIPPLNWPRGQF